MSSEFGSRLLFWVNNTIEPLKLTNEKSDADEVKKINAFFTDIIAEWKMEISISLLGISDDQQKKIWLKAQQEQMVMLSDQINHYLHKNQRVWVNHHRSSEIKGLYIRYLGVLEDLISYIRDKFPEFYDQTIKVTDYKSLFFLPELRHTVFKILNELKQKSVDSALVSVIATGLNQLVCPGKATTAGIRYINFFSSELDKTEIHSNEQLIEFLISARFNQPEFYLYHTDRLTQRLTDIEGLHEELEFVYRQKEILVGISPRYQCQLYPKQKCLREELLRFYNEKANYLNDLLNLRRQSMQDKFDSDVAFRILTTMSVPQLALFVRILKERGVLLKEGLTELFTFFARHFYTDKALFISSNSLLKKSTDIDFATALKLWDMLHGMLDWLDEKFNIKGYKKSV